MTSFIDRLIALVGPEVAGKVLLEFGGSTQYVPRHLLDRGEDRAVLPDGTLSKHQAQRIALHIRTQEIVAQSIEAAFRREMNDLMYAAVAGSPKDHCEALAKAQGSVQQLLAAHEWLQRCEALSSPHTAQS